MKKIFTFILSLILFIIMIIIIIIIIIIILQRVRTRAIPYPHQPPFRGDAIVSVAKVVLSPLALLVALLTGLDMKTNRAKVPLCGLSS